MKKIRLLPLVLAFVMVFAALTACLAEPNTAGPVNQDTNTQPATTLNSEVNADSTESNVEADQSGNGYITSKDAFISKMNELLDISLYDDLEESDAGAYKSYYYQLNYENEKDFDLDDTVSLGDGSSFTMPITFAELEEKGWVLQETSDPDRELEPGFMTFGTVQNAAGESLYVSAYNHTQDVITFKECTVIEVEARQYSSIEPTEKVEGAVDFTVCGTLTNLSALEDIIQRLGNPYAISCTLHYDSDGNYAYTELEIEYEQESSAYSSIVFELSGDGNYITNMKYSVGPQ